MLRPEQALANLWEGSAGVLVLLEELETLFLILISGERIKLAGLTPRKNLSLAQ